MKKNLFVALLLLFILLPLPAQRLVHSAPQNPYELIVDAVLGASPITFDPANCYDASTGELLFNIYEPLISFDKERYDNFIPRLAEQVWVAPPDPAAPTYTNYTVYFKIRMNVPFHVWCRSDLGTLVWNQYYLTTEDVEHSLERIMVLDYICGPQWMIFEPLLRCYGADITWPSDETNPINMAVQRNATHVWLNIANKDRVPRTSTLTWAPVALYDSGKQRSQFWSDVAKLPLSYPPRVFLQIISQPWASIMSKQWLVNYVGPMAKAADPTHPGEWNGNWTEWLNFHNPEVNQLPAVDIIPGGATDPGVTCGTGPYILDRFDAATEWSGVKFDDYWGGWPANWYGYRQAGWVTRLTVRQKDRPTRIAELINGECDFAYLSTSDWTSLHVNGDLWKETLHGIRLQYWKAPQLLVQYLFFTFNITPSGAYGKINNYGELSEDGIPRDFFSDIHVRKAFAQCINFTYIINDLAKGLAYQPATFAPNGLPYVNLTQKCYFLDVEKAKEEFTLAWDGELLNTGFTVTLPYSGTFDALVYQSLAGQITSIGNEIAGGKFHVQLKFVTWGKLVQAMAQHELPVFMVGWLADYADLNSFAYVVLYSEGPYRTLAPYQNYKNQIVDNLIEAGMNIPDGPLRQKIYYTLEKLYYEDVPSVPLYTPITRCYMRDCVYGYYRNVLHPGIFAYSVWKWNYLKGDVNYDGKVSMADIIIVIDSFGSYVYKNGTFAVHQRWSFHCDIDDSPMYRWRDQKISMEDIIQICQNFGKTSMPWQPP